MILLKFLLIVLTLFIYICKCLEFLYRYQIKEYRWDRMKSYLKEEGLFSALYGIRMEFPSKSARNLATFGVLFTGAILYSWFIYRLPLSLLQLQLILAPLAAFIDVSAIVWITSFLVKWHRKKVISRAQSKLSQSKAKVIMITGSYGKTSVKEYLYQMLKEKYNVAKTDENMNTDIGVAICINKNLKQNTDYFIAEVGAYRIGEIADICAFVKPNYVVITAFGNQHLDLYGSHANLVQAESEPLDYLDKDGIAFINADIDEFEKITKGRTFIIKTFSTTTKSAFVYASLPDTSEEGTSAPVKLDNHSFDIKTKMLGKHTIQNILPVLGISYTLGMTIAEIKKAVTKIKPIKGKLSLHKGPNGSTILNDSGNSNLQGFLKAIEVASMFSHKNKFIVSKGIIELGEEKEKSYRQILSKLSGTTIDLYTTDSTFSHLGNKNNLAFASEEELQNSLIHQLDSSTLVVIEGKFSPAFLDAMKIAK